MYSRGWLFCHGVIYTWCEVPYFVCNHHIYSPGKTIAVGGSTVSCLLGKTCGRRCRLFPPLPGVNMPAFLSRRCFSIPPLLDDCHRFLVTQALALSATRLKRAHHTYRSSFFVCVGNPQEVSNPGAGAQQRRQLTWVRHMPPYTHILHFGGR